MSFLDAALKLAHKGFHVFPLGENSKLPLIADFPTRATREEFQIIRWWTDPVLGTQKPYNIGISTSKFGEDEALLVVDIDVKKQGHDTLFALECEGRLFPRTFIQTTASGGEHLVYRVKAAVKQGTDVFGRGLDVRSRGGYIVGSGSCIGAKAYTFTDYPLCLAPEWTIEACGRVNEKEVEESPKYISRERALQRATFYLRHEAPLALEGASGDQTTFGVAARLKDFGLGTVDALEQLLEVWNERCSPSWTPTELKIKVENAYLYGKNTLGQDAPETSFPAVESDAKRPHPFSQINSQFAFVLAGGGHHILWETKDIKGRFKLEHLNESSFHAKFAASTMDTGGGKQKPVTELWMADKSRRSYDGMCFSPEQPTPPEWYNLWKGFAVKPAKEAKHEALDAFLEHTETNVCGGDPKLTRWLLGYFAHIIQKPWEKPLTALVFRGAKGVGKNALVDRIGHLLGNHYLLTSDRRYLIGNFNGHLENCLLFALDEAFWSGDKQAEGTLKTLITGNSHNIEHKGKEIYTVDNCTRVCILGNDDWLIPASHDERRYAVFQVGDGRKQDRKFFFDMRIGMEKGGYGHLLKYLLDFDLRGIEIDEAPQTKALLDQKEATLEPFEQWWLLCLQEGEIVGADFGTDWPAEVGKERFRDAFYRYIRERNIKGRLHDSRGIGRVLTKLAPKTNSHRKRTDSGEALHVYQIPDLAECRKNWGNFIGHQVEWN